MYALLSLLAAGMVLGLAILAISIMIYESVDAAQHHIYEDDEEESF